MSQTTCSCGLAWPFRAVESVGYCGHGYRWSLRVTTHGIYTSMYIYLQRQSQLTPHSCLTVRIPSAGSALPCVSVRFPNIHNSPLRPASPRLLRRAIPRQSLASPGDATSSLSPWLQLPPPMQMKAPVHCPYRDPDCWPGYVSSLVLVITVT